MRTSSFEICRSEITESKNREWHGKWIHWYNNGQKHWIYIFRDGKYHGKYIVWFEDGLKFSEGEYTNGNIKTEIEYHYD